MKSILVVTGSRDADEIECRTNIEWAMCEYPGLPFDWVWHGACPSGADKVASELCKERGMKERKFPADWKEYGRRAGPIRNREMMQAAAYECVQGAIVLVLALPSHKGTSKGTLGAIKEAFEAKLEVVTAWVG